MKETIEIIEIKPYGFVVQNHTRNVKQLLPKEYLKKRLMWGLYEIINLMNFQYALT
ncbi:MAG TPA: hypothetical protein PKC30_06020 [Saprospiraceae bacterium]|nr:hypothetical protein [Saprospiraceae bacterium]